MKKLIEELEALTERNTGLDAGMKKIGAKPSTKMTDSGRIWNMPGGGQIHIPTGATPAKGTNWRERTEKKVLDLLKSSGFRSFRPAQSNAWTVLLRSKSGPNIDKLKKLIKSNFPVKEQPQVKSSFANPDADFTTWKGGGLFIELGENEWGIKLEIRLKK